MLQDLVDYGEVSKEDKEFIDMTHRNTELLEQLKQRDEVIDEIYNFVNRYRHYIEVNNKDYLKDREHYGYLDKWQTDDLLEILQKYKGDNK